MRFSKKTYLAFVYAGVGVLSTLLLAVIISRLVYPFDSGHYEAFSWQPTRHVLLGENPYSFAHTPPFSMAPYGIVHYALLAVGVKLFGFQLFWGRALSVIAFAVCLLAIVNITKKIAPNREAPWVALLAGLAVFPPQAWVAIVRPDLIALAFSLTALWLVFDLEDEGNHFWRIGVAGLLAAAAFFTKQTSLLVVFVSILRLLQLRKRRELVCFVSAVVILIGAGILLLNYTSSGGYAWQHYTHARKLPFSFARSTHQLVEMLKLPTVIIFAAALMVFAYRRREILHGPGENRASAVLRSPGLLILIYFMLSFGWAFLSAGRVGANLNYYLENSLITAVGFALICGNYKRKDLPAAASLIIILLVSAGTFQLVRVLRGEYLRRQSFDYYSEVAETAAKLTPPNSTCVSVYAELVVSNGCALHFDDFGEYASGWSPELWEIFERELAAGSYPVIIWGTDDLQRKFPNYQLVPMSRKPPERFFPVYLYVRRNS